MVVLLVAGVLAADYYFKRAVVEHLERKMADAGFVGEVGEFNYGITRRELSVRDLHAVPSGTVLADLGEVSIAEGTIQFDPDESKGISEVKIRGVEAAMGSASKITIHPGKSFSAKDVSLKNAKEFGGGNLIKVAHLQVEYGVKGLDLVKVKVAELTAVKNKKGQWNLLVKPVKELKFRNEQNRTHRRIPSRSRIGKSTGPVTRRRSANRAGKKKQSEPATSTARLILIQKFCPRCKFCLAK